MLFASSFSEGVFMTILFVGVGVWSLRRLFGQFDKGGKIKDAAQDGLADWITRKLKK
jgi:hypothetical protein